MLPLKTFFGFVFGTVGVTELRTVVHRLVGAGYVIGLGVEPLICAVSTLLLLVPVFVRLDCVKATLFRTYSFQRDLAVGYFFHSIFILKLRRE